LQVLADVRVDVSDELALLTRLERIAFDEAFGEPDDAQLEAATELDVRPGPARHLDAATADVDHDRDVAGNADSVNRCQMDQPGFLGSRDDPRPDSGLLIDRL
jgi:hypothetical protein